MHSDHNEPQRLPRRLVALVAVLGVALLAAAFGRPAPAAAQAPLPFGMVKDFGDTTYTGGSMDIGGALSFHGAVVAGPIAYFQAYTPDAGYEIWRSDGTDAGTFMLKDLCPGDAGLFSGPQLALGTNVYFVANDCASGLELWKSDGTAAGTQRVKDINPGPDSGGVDKLFAVGDTLFFIAYDGTKSSLWKSDGTEAGTVATGLNGTPIFALGNGLFFTTFVGAVCHIERLDATSNAVSDLTTMCPSSVYGNDFAGISIAAGTTLAYFTTGDSVTGTEIWRSDGTPAGTFLLKDIRPGAESSQPSNFIVSPSNDLLFSATDGTSGRELWASGGLAVNTKMLKDINPGPNSSDAGHFTVWHHLIFFTAYDGTQTELWRTDETSLNTAIVKDLTPVPGVSSNPQFLTSGANALFFSASDGVHSGALFKTDGSAGGTVLVKYLNSSEGIYAPKAFGAGIFFRGDDGVHGGEPWFSDGSDAGTYMIKDIVGDENLSSQPVLLTPLNGQVLYFGYNVSGAPGDPYALYRSDGSATGTLMLKTFGSGPGYFSTAAQTSAIFNGALYFAASDTGGSSKGVELWRSDGGASGTTLFADLYPGASSGNPASLTPSQQTLYFRASTSSSGDELWKTNGTLETTAMIKDIQTGSTGSFPTFLTADGAGGVYFAANDGTAGTELWHSDGSAANTRMLLDIAPGSDGSFPENLTLAGTNLFFTAQDATAGRELWVTNGTPEGTKRVRDITTGTASSSFEPYQQPFAVLGNRVFFVASSDLFGNELWSSDGTETGTAIVKDVFPGAAQSDIQALTAMSGAVYFVATGDDDKRTLWRSDGTTAGTARVVSGPSAPANPEAFSVIDGRLYFSAADQSVSAGRELWVSDGTAAGTRMLQDLNADPTNSSPRDVVKSGTRLYLSAYKPGAGVELWSAQTQRSVYVPAVRR